MVECGRLEIVCGRKLTGGSNPSPSDFGKRESDGVGLGAGDTLAKGQKSFGAGDISKALLYVSGGRGGCDRNPPDF